MCVKKSHSLVSECLQIGSLNKRFPAAAIIKWLNPTIHVINRNKQDVWRFFPLVTGKHFGHAASKCRQEQKCREYLFHQELPLPSRTPVRQSPLLVSGDFDTAATSKLPHEGRTAKPRRKPWRRGTSLVYAYDYDVRQGRQKTDTKGERIPAPSHESIHLERR